MIEKKYLRQLQRRIIWSHIYTYIYTCIYVSVYTHLAMLLKEKEAYNLRECVEKLGGSLPGRGWRDEREKERDN